MRQQQKVIVVGAGQNGLIAACYLALAGREVLVLEQSPEPGGGSRTEERLPGYRFDTHAVAHNLLHMTTIGQELDLAGAGLDYIEMNPFAVALRADGRRVRFYRSIEATVASIAENDREEADAYAAFMQVALSMVQALLPSIRGEAGVAPFSRRFVALVRALRHRRSTATCTSAWTTFDLRAAARSAPAFPSRGGSISSSRAIFGSIAVITAPVSITSPSSRITARILFHSKPIVSGPDDLVATILMGRI